MFKHWNSPRGASPDDKVVSASPWKPWLTWAIKAACIVIIIDGLSALMFEPTYNSGWYTGFTIAWLGGIVYDITFKEVANEDR